MAEEKKPKTVKKITEIPNASVTIEVEETAEGEKTSTKIVPTETPSDDSVVMTDPIDTKETIETKEVAQTNDEMESDGGFGWKKVFLTILIVVPIGLLMFGGILFFSNGFNFSFMKKDEAAKKLELPEMTPTPTKAEVNKSAHIIEIKNGSGITGEGAKVKETLEAADFKVGDVGNADNAKYTATIIKVNKDVPQGYIDALTATLEQRGSVGKVETFAAGEEGDVLVIIGSSVKDTTPTPTK